ncbi:MAG TPA: pilus assembly protein TadG-related protein [Acidobacteriaceae bacterium]|nr:pilus assembly protein TadG-related protein [Acidobacteriaceae bacterium]
MRFAAKLKDESGQAMILTLLSMTVLLGFVGFAADVGTLLRAKRNLQIAADSAAIAAAAELNYADSTAAGQAAAAQNGVVIGTNGGAVAINTPPTEGAYEGQAGYVEAIVSQIQPTFFMNVFNISSQLVTARAVATASTSNGCVYVLNPTSTAAMVVQGSFIVSSTSGCEVVVDSTDPAALQINGAGALTAGSVGVAGPYSAQGGTSTPAPVPGMAQVSDPFGGMTAPTPAGCTTPPGALTGTITAGCYSAPAGSSLTLTNVTLGAGTYVLEGNVILSGTVTSSAGGTTLDIANGALSESPGTVLDLVAPTSGDYNGIAVMEPAPNANPMVLDLGNSSGLIDGIIYAPDAELTLQNSSGNAGALQLTTDLIVNLLNDQVASLTITNYSQTVSNSPLTKVALVE